MAENSKKALIFGACGFAGRYLIQEMKEYGYHVFGCDLLKNENADLCESFSICDILDEKQVKTTIRNVHPTHIINLAAISSVGLSWNLPLLCIKRTIKQYFQNRTGCYQRTWSPYLGRNTSGRRRARNVFYFQ